MESAGVGRAPPKPQSDCADVLMAPDHTRGCGQELFRSCPLVPRVAHTRQQEGSLTEDILFVAAAWMGLGLVAIIISIRLGISVALVEMFVGVIGGTSSGSTPSH